MQEEVTQNTVGWALAHGVAFRTSPSTTRHTPFALTPTPITRERFHHLKTKAGLLGKLVHAASEDDEFLKQAMEPITDGDFFFHQLWSMHQHLSKPENQLQRLPLLIMRTDFMDDAQLGPKVIEFNGIAAGMAPFGQRIHELHSYVQTQWPDSYSTYGSGNTINNNNKLVENRALEGLADGIAKATRQIKQEFKDKGPPRFLMIVQPNEDNVFDQHLLEFALQARGIQTVRRSFQELYGTLKTGDHHRLVLDGVGSIDTVYLRAGYLHCDYYSKELDGDTFAADKCCQSLMKTRCFIERHRVAMNATVNQQLASSKRVQTLLSAMTAHQLTSFGLTLQEAEAVKDLLGENWPVNAESLQWMQQPQQNIHQWVLKNQGEGGGHAIMGDDILPKLQQLSATPKEYPAWSLMRRLRPLPRPKPTLMIRDGMATECANLISEIGIFSVHINGVPATTDNEKEEHHNGYVGYLIRSKPSDAREGGVHSGLGVLDSLVYQD